MRTAVREFVSICASSFKDTIIEPIYEFGSYQVEGYEEVADLRVFFPDRQYIGSDMREGPGVDVILDLHQIDLPDESVGTVVMMETLEHVKNPYLALQEIYRILKPGGLVICNSAMDFPIHEYPYDYWRFTPEAFKSILEPFESSFVGYGGLEEYPHTVIGIAIKGRSQLPDIEKFKEQYVKWQEQWKWDLYAPPYVNYTTVLDRLNKLTAEHKTTLERLSSVEQEYGKSLKEVKNLRQQINDASEYAGRLEKEYLNKQNYIDRLEGLLRQTSWRIGLKNSLVDRPKKLVSKVLSSLNSSPGKNQSSDYPAQKKDYYPDKSLREWLVYHQHNIAFDKCSWMGLKTIKNPLDLWVYQELIFRIKPDVIVEIGSYEGGSTLYFAHLLELLNNGTVISIDIYRHNYKAEHSRIVSLTGYSNSTEIIKKVAELCKDKKVMVVQDGDHRKEAVLEDLRLYSEFVSVGSYFIVEDGIVDFFRPEEMKWTDQAGPFMAIEQFLEEDHRFTPDKECERYILTYNPKGFLKRIK